MVVVVNHPLVEAVKLKFDVGLEIFIGELVVNLILFVNSVAPYFLLGFQPRKFPIDDAALLLISQ